MAATTTSRGSWGSSFGFILAAAGSAIGLGNIWGFPYKASQSGGAAFVALYLICVLIVGIPVMFAELSIGRSTQKSPVSAFRALAPRSAWWLVGAQGVLSGFCILAFYSVIAGWTLGYLYMAITGRFTAGVSLEQSEAMFDGLRGNPAVVVLWTGGFFVLSILVVRGGVHGGIERASRVLMPVFFFLLVGLAVRATTLEGGAAGVHFLFNVDFSKVTADVVLDALSQAFFSMSLGMGAMITYGSYLARRENLPRAGLTVGLSDTAIALLSGLMIFPALFAAGATPTEGPGLVFVVLPTIFDAMPAGVAFAVAFYALLVIAALTSSISLLEVITAFFVDELRWGRERAVWLFGGVCFALAVPCALWSGFMDLLIMIFFDYALLVGGLFICLFVGWRWKPAGAIAEMRAEGRSFPGLSGWGLLIRFFCPVVIAIIIANQLWSALKPAGQ